MNAVLPDGMVPAELALSAVRGASQGAGPGVRPGDPPCGSGDASAERDARDRLWWRCGGFPREITGSSLFITWCFRTQGPRVRMEERLAPTAQHFGLNGNVWDIPDGEECRYLANLLLFL